MSVATRVRRAVARQPGWRLLPIGAESRMASSPVIGRDTEIEAIRDFLGMDATGPAGLSVTGPPGIGKTALWELGVEHARGRFGSVLTQRSVEAEAGLAFAGLSDLLAPVLDAVRDGLAPPRRRALEVAMLLADPGTDEPLDLRAIGLALLDVLHTLADRGPVLIALDDLQWLDAPSAAILPVAVRRLQAEPVGLLATLREAPGVSAPFSLRDVLPEGHAARLRVGPLDDATLSRLLRERLALELPRPLLRRVAEVSTGNPFFALELGRELVRTGGQADPDGALPVPETLRDLLGGRLARLPGGTSDVLLEVAALARPTSAVLTRGHERPNAVIEALDAAARAGVIAVDGARVRFTHPLLASMVYEQAPPWARAAVHDRLATRVTDPEERARHLALATEDADEAVATQLDAAGRHAAARGASSAAAELAELAALRTPPDAAEDRRRRRLHAAAWHGLAGALTRAASIYDDVLNELPAGPDRADVLYALAMIAGRDFEATADLCEQALEHADADDARCAQILGYLAIARWGMGDVPRPWPSRATGSRGPSARTAPVSWRWRWAASDFWKPGRWT